MKFECSQDHQINILRLQQQNGLAQRLQIQKNRSTIPLNPRKKKNFYSQQNLHPNRGQRLHLHAYLHDLAKASTLHISVKPARCLQTQIRTTNLNPRRVKKQSNIRREE